MDKECLRCKKILNIEEFRKCEKKNGRIFIRSKCITCERIEMADYRNTFKGFFKQLFDNAKYNAKQRKNKGRKTAGIFDLTYEQIVDLYYKQNGKCYYSGIEMNLQKCSDWQCSLERLDNNKGYIIDNVVLVCLEFNGRVKWTKEKIKEMVLKILEIPDIEQILKDINNAISFKKVRRPRREIIYKMIKNIKHWKCDKCDEFKPINELRKREGGCIECRIKKRKEYLATIKGHIHLLLDGAKKHTKERKQIKSRSNNNKINDVFDLTFKDAIEILRNQRGLCHYSGIKMNYGSHLEKNWVASLERIDPLKGYTKNNVCFICCELNTFDRTSVYKHKSTGASNWSPKKFLHFLQTICRCKKKYNLDEIF